MTAAAPALGIPVPTRRPRVDTVDVCPQPITRQARARRVMFKVAGGFLGVVVVATGQQVAAHGWRSFVYRAPGVGGTPAAHSSSGGTGQASAGPTHITAGTGLASAAPSSSPPTSPPDGPPTGPPPPRPCPPGHSLRPPRPGQGPPADPEAKAV